MKLLDSSILAYAFYDNEYTSKCQSAIREGGIANTLNLIEAFFIIEKETSRDVAISSIKGLLKSNLTIIDADINLIFEALKKIGSSKLSIFDMIHYSCAKLNGCSAILSYDRDFDNLDIKRQEP